GQDRDRPEVAIQIGAIQEAVATASGITRAELVSASRVARVAHARELGMYLSRQLTDAPVAAIARAFDRDHTTVLHATRVVEGRLEPGSDTLLTIHRAREILGIGVSENAAPSPQPSSNPATVNMHGSRSTTRDSRSSPHSSTT